MRVPPPAHRTDAVTVHESDDELAADANTAAPKRKCVEPGPASPRLDRPSIHADTGTFTEQLSSPPRYEALKMAFSSPLRQLSPTMMDDFHLLVDEKTGKEDRVRMSADGARARRTANASLRAQTELELSPSHLAALVSTPVRPTRSRTAVWSPPCRADG